MTLRFESLRGQSTVEPMLVMTGIVLTLVLSAYIWDDQFQRLVWAIGEWVATRIELP
ncbi:MAG: hypothetical protein Q8P41_14890 [Pseudomonadota bacterium]|nr:hypothetical protein [Pseudomonadota bacterium]